MQIEMKKSKKETRKENEQRKDLYMSYKDKHREKENEGGRNDK